MSIFDAIKKWDLDSPTIDFNSFSKKAVGQIAHDIQNCYLKAPPPSAGRFNQSLHTATQIVESHTSAENLALPLLFSKQLMLPDPLFSLMAPRATAIWQRLPEGGNKSFAKTPLIQSQWKSYWMTETSERFAYLNTSVPPLLKQLIKLKPLIEAGHILLQPWELAVEAEIESLRSSVFALQKKPDVLKEVTQKYRQGQYHSGVRVGAVDLSVSEDWPDQGLKKGDPMWFGESSEVLVVGLIHSIFASAYSSSLLDTLPGDRLVFDYVRTGGILRPRTEALISSVKVPNLSTALWSDIVAIKKDSEILAKLQEVITEVSYCEEEHQKAILKDEISSIESRIKADTTLMKYANLAVSDFTVGAIATGVSNTMTGSSLKVGALAAAAGTAVSFGYKFASEYFSPDNRSKRKRRDLIVKLNGQL